MRLPDELRQALDTEIAAIDARSLSQASARLSEKYKQGEFAQAPLDSAAMRAAYLVARLPATYAANLHVFGEIARLSASEPRTLLDLGSGPGTTCWAATDAIPSLERVTAVERDSALLSIARRLAAFSPHEAMRQAEFVNADLGNGAAAREHDVVVLSYVLGEIPASKLPGILNSAWRLARQLLVIIEPGTPRNFAIVNSARTMLIDAGAHLLAPCPHMKVCPMAALGDWCHFAQRIERTSEHRRLKQGTLGYEDEKFSYIVASRTPVQTPEARIIRHPMKYSGYVQLPLCVDGKFERRTITRSQKALYRAARKAEWGDAWEQETLAAERDS